MVIDSQQNELPFQIDHPNEKLGQRLTISLNLSQQKHQQFNIQIFYTTSPKAAAFSWLRAEQTESKTLPYLFSQCESANCRSIAPLQDTPSIKSTYTAKITVNNPALKVFMSAN